MSGSSDILDSAMAGSDVEDVESDVDDPVATELPETKCQPKIFDYYRRKAASRASNVKSSTVIHSETPEKEIPDEPTTSTQSETVTETSNQSNYKSEIASKTQEATESDEEFSAIVDMVINRSNENKIQKNVEQSSSQSTQKTNTDVGSHSRRLSDAPATSDTSSLDANTLQSQSNSASSSSFNITDSTVELEDVSDMSQVHCVSVDVVSEDVDNSQECSEEEEVVNTSQATVSSESSDSEKKIGIKRHYQVSHKMGDLKFTKARRITAKLKKQWASDLHESGQLMCPMPGCRQTYKTVANFQTHYKWCTGKKDLQHCPHCDSLIFSGRDAVLHHMQVEHPDKVEEFKEKYKEISKEHQVAESRSPTKVSNFMRHKVIKRYPKLKARGLSSKENFHSREKTLKSGIKSVDKSPTNFKKCVRFNDIVQKINSVNEEPFPRASMLLKKPKPSRQTHREIFELNAQTETQYFSDESDTVDNPEIEDGSPMASQKISTKSRIVLNTQGYERFNQYLKMTRDWASERKTYSRSRADGADSSFNESGMSEDASLPIDLTDSYQLNESLNTSISDAVIKSELEEEETNPNPKLSMKNEKVSQRNNAQRVKKTLREIPVRSDLVGIDEEATTNAQSEKPKGSRFPSVQNAATPDPRELNYGHVVFAKPNKVANRERVTCYDNAGNVSISLSATPSPLNSYSAYRRQRSENAAIETISFDKLLESTKAANALKDETANKIDSESSKKQEVATQPSDWKSPVKKGNKDSKYQKQIDGIKLPKGRAKRTYSKSSESSQYNEALRESYIPSKSSVSEGQKAQDSVNKLSTLKNLSLTAVLYLLEKCNFVSNVCNFKSSDFNDSFWVIKTLIDHVHQWQKDRSNDSDEDTVPIIDMDIVRDILCNVILPSHQCYPIAPVPLIGVTVKKRGRRPRIIEQLKQLFSDVSELDEELKTEVEDELDSSIRSKKEEKDSSYTPTKATLIAINSSAPSNEQGKRYQTRKRKRRSSKYGPEYDLDDNNDASGAIASSEARDKEIADEVQKIMDDNSINQISQLVSKDIVPGASPPEVVVKKRRGRPPKVKPTQFEIEVTKSQVASVNESLPKETMTDTSPKKAVTEDTSGTKATTGDPNIISVRAVANSDEPKFSSLETFVAKIGLTESTKADGNAEASVVEDAAEKLPIQRTRGRKRKAETAPNLVPLKQQKIDSLVEICPLPKKRGRARISSPIVPVDERMESPNDLPTDTVSNDTAIVNADSLNRKCARKGTPQKCIRYETLNSGIDSPESMEEITQTSVASQNEALIESVPNAEESVENKIPVGQPIGNDQSRKVQSKQLAVLKSRKFFLSRRKHQVVLPKSPQRRKSDEMEVASSTIDTQAKPNIQVPARSYPVRSKRAAAIVARKMFSSMSIEVSTTSIVKTEDIKDEDFVPPPDVVVEMEREREPKLDARVELEQFRLYFSAPVIEERKATRTQIRTWLRQLETTGRIVCGRKECGRVLETKAGMIYHFEHSCMKQNQRWTCNICNKSTKPSSDLMLSHLKKRHMKTLDPSVQEDVERRLKHGHITSLSSEKFPLRLQEFSNLFPDFKPKRKDWKFSDTSKLKDYLAYSKSIPFKISNTSNDTSTWISLESFQKCKDHVDTNQIIFFTGGPVLCSAWCPTPEKEKSDQYIMIATSAVSERYHSMSTDDQDRGLLQLWHCGQLEQTTVTTPPELKLAIMLNLGKIWAMSWCPSGCWEPQQQPNTENPILERLGVIAIACSDSFVRLYSIPQPSSLEIPSEQLLLFDGEPVALLKPAQGETCHATQKAMCTSISWQRTDNCRHIACGYSNGLVSLYQVSETSELLTNVENGKLIISPYLTFDAHSAAVLQLDFAPLQDGRYLATCGFDKSIKVWDLLEPDSPVVESRKGGVPKILQWPCCWTGLFVCFSEALIYSQNTTTYQDLSSLRRRKNFSHQKSFGTSFSVSEMLNVAAVGVCTGSLTVSELLKLNVEYTKGTIQDTLIYKTRVTSTSDSPNDVSSQVVKNSSTDDNYGLVFEDSNNGSTQEENEETEHMNCKTLNFYRKASINSLAWNPNQGPQSWIFTANQSGICRLMSLPAFDRKTL